MARARSSAFARARSYLRDWLQLHWENGIDCPVCGKPTKLYRRPLNSGMVRALVCLRYLGMHQTELDDDWVQVSSRVYTAEITQQLQHWEYTKLRHWGLIENQGGPDAIEMGESDGVWRLTELGEDFLLQPGTTVLSHIHLVHDRVVGRSGEQITASQALTVRFDLAELMEGTWGYGAPR